ncbi:EscF/YscF/HrpA family type III secretion system needle major subunit [Salmonella enterica subsp. salamae]|uniref:EscF/YscF/HrpA family type III secretion system needle major subunit n=15 Tax=Salmonella enterica TaxID=28901 RepID=A0A0F5BFV5_SALER|nr:type III secretion system needle filament subunit SctF [Salmonella enterica]AFO66347.1 putative LEE-encoded type III secretion system structural component [Salmonella enterica subsp. salamae serovar Sofia]EBI0478758.1 EscF/YscF/HrpA family type III secretion system needle major subunit [Salmonella enterica subsp. enterica serovar Braenderup]EBK2700524.1 EscF/YscF/HrpA family type III secretion system needle major subunit [Salmonella enterica subsp. enterica serovar Paratyphi B]ECG1420305.1 E
MNLSEITDQMGKVGKTLSNSVPDLLNSSDLVNDPDKMIELQFAVQQYSAYINVESGMLKTIKDLVSTISNRTF